MINTKCINFLSILNWLSIDYWSIVFKFNISKNVSKNFFVITSFCDVTQKKIYYCNDIKHCVYVRKNFRNVFHIKMNFQNWKLNRFSIDEKSISFLFIIEKRIENHFTIWLTKIQTNSYCVKQQKSLNLKYHFRTIVVNWSIENQCLNIELTMFF